MAKHMSQTEPNLYYINNGQGGDDTIEDVIKRKKNKEREKRIKQNKKKHESEEIDLETEEVIKMTNKNRLKKEEERRRVISKKQVQLKKRKKKIRRILELLMILIITIGGIIFAMVSPIFNVKDIEVMNNERVTSDTIISLSKLQIGQNIFRFNKRSIINDIKENAYMQDVIIHRKLPDKVQIDIKEKIPQYSIDFMGKYAYINTQGYILEISENSNDLPIIRGISTQEENIVEGKRLNTEDLTKIEDVIKIMSAARDVNLDSKITEINIKDKIQYVVEIKEEKKKIYLGDGTNLSNKMLYVIGIIENNKEKEGEIFVNGDLNNKFQPYFREKV